MVDALALLCTAAGLVAGLVVLSASRAPLLAVGVALEFWTAAGLLRLAGPLTWQRLVTAAAIVALRRLLGVSLRAGHGGGAPPRSAGRAARGSPLRPRWW